jgi:uncharacterized protein YPO0396
MSDSPLFHIDGSTEGTTQWRAETFQMVNWGGFQGFHTFAFARDATLVSGASGTGKSSLLDAYLALMMPSDTPFNGASNDAGSGRARSSDQRNLLTYLKGKTDSSREADTGEMHDTVLRGADSSTWGAVGMTFIDDNSRRFTVLRAYFVPRGGTRPADITMKMATVDGRLDLRELADAVESRFDKRVLRNRFTDMDVFDTYAAFAQTLYTRLGIGANGEGGKALRLLARIQAGQQMKSVDGLFKSMVLEEPPTYAAADKAVTHFEDLERSYGAMVTEAQKASVLERLPELHRDYESAMAKSSLVDALGVDRTGTTPLLLWQLSTERRLLATAEDDNRTRREQNQRESARAKSTESELKARVAEIQRQERDNGGDVLLDLESEHDALVARRDDVAAEHGRFSARTAVLSTPTGTPEEFGAARAAATDAIEGFEAAETRLETERDGIRKKSYPLEAELHALRLEREFLAGRESLVPQHLHHARLAVAEALGVSPDELPFAAELIDVAPEQQQWRDAVEVTLGPIARIMLVDENRLDALSAAIDPMRLATRIQFQGVPLEAFSEIEGDPRYVSGKLLFKDSPFGAWVQSRVTSSGIDALCVDGPSDLAGPGRRVTLSGQSRNGKSGSHGGNREQKRIIGLSSRGRLDEIDSERTELEAGLARLTQDEAGVAASLALLRERRDAHRVVLDAQWDAIDVAGAERAVLDKKAEWERVLTTSDVLRTLKHEEEVLAAQLEAAQELKHVAKRLAVELEAEQAAIVDREDAVSGELERIALEDPEPLSDEQRAYLDAQFSAVGDLGDVASFSSGVRRLRDRLTEQARSDRGSAQGTKEALVAIFETFQSRWPDPNIGVTLDSYTSYQDILDSVLTLGLHERRQEWKRRLSTWSGQDLVPLVGAFATSVEEIEDRLRPVNEILSSLPFGAGRDRLRISLRRLHRDDSAAFRKELKALSSGSTETLTDEEVEQRFQRLQAFMALIRRPEDDPRAPAGPSSRDLLLDVRKHVEITAVRETEDGVEVSVYSSLGGKSGGESQELVAFVVGAALRFQLGDESRTRPRFAPVFLDEGFVKSDAEFAGRSVAAWLGLGFQLVIGSPLDKVTALEPYMDSMLSVTKNHVTGYSYITPMEPSDDAEAVA